LLWKPAFFCKVKKIKHLSGGVVLYAAQTNVQIDAAIAEKSGFQTKNLRGRENAGNALSPPFAALQT